MRWLLCLVLVGLMVAAQGSSYFQARDKPRSIRGFKNAALSTARGFGKRALDSPPQPIPVEWMEKELSANEDLSRYVVRSLLDTDGDGMLTPSELLRPLHNY